MNESLEMIKITPKQRISDRTLEQFDMTVCQCRKSRKRLPCPALVLERISVVIFLILQDRIPKNMFEKLVSGASETGTNCGGHPTGAPLRAHSGASRGKILAVLMAAGHETKLIPADRTSERIVEQTVDAPVPRILEEIVEPVTGAGVAGTANMLMLAVHETIHPNFDTRWVQVPESA